MKSLTALMPEFDAVSGVRNWVATLLNSDNAADAKPAVDALLDIFVAITGLQIYPDVYIHDAATHTAYGKAISPLEAAKCAADIERSRVFLQGIYQALQDILREQQTVDVLYAGSGPFGWLLTPLLPLFDPGRVRITFIDIHSESLDHLDKVLRALCIRPGDYSMACADATQWQPCDDDAFDVIVSETMMLMLQREPQVQIFAHLQQFLKPQGLLIPQRIKIDAWLSNGTIEEAALENQTSSAQWLGTLLELQRDTAARLHRGDRACLRGSLPVPQYDEALTDLKFTTEIQVCGQHWLRERQSQLSLPVIQRDVRLEPASKLRFEYCLDALPGFQFYYRSKPRVADQPLPDSLDASSLGICHLKRLWHKSRRQQAGRLDDELQRREWHLDLLLIDELGLGLERGISMLHATDSLAAFERRVLEVHQGVIDRSLIKAINRRVRQQLDGAAAGSILLSPAGPREPVLSAEQLCFWQEHGYLIVPAVLDAEQCRASEQAIWRFLNKDPLDKGSWYQTHPAWQGIMVQCFDDAVLCRNRSNAKIRRVFEQLWQTDDLIVAADRASFNPPETAHWRFPGPDMHWDVALRAPIAYRTQALIYLTDTAEQQGAFRCVPGFHKQIDDWLAGLRSNADPQQQDWAGWDIQSIAAKAGDMIVWHQALPHGSGPNRADYPRIVQYINMYPCQP